MKADSKQWIQMGPAATDDEQRALNLLRDVLPDAPTSWAWSNVTFIDGSGRMAEVDAIVLNQSGLYVFELKGWRGSITGGQQRWNVTSEHSRRREERNPLLGTRTKAQLLVSLLDDVKSHERSDTPIPFIKPITVMHGSGSRFQLDDIGSQYTYALDGAEVNGLPKLSTLVTSPTHSINKEYAGQLVRLLMKAGFTPTPKQRMVGQYVIDLKNPLAEGDSWVDVEAQHHSLPDTRRRIRLYDVPPNASKQQRKGVADNALREFRFTNGIGHAGVVTALEYFDTESGPALLFPADNDSTPLDAWLTANYQEASLETRLALLRQVAEVMRYAHGHRIQHRALSPSKVRVSTKPGGALEVTVRDWQSAVKQPGSQSMTAGLTALRGGLLALSQADAKAETYLAPETESINADPVALDVYSLGSLAYLLLTDQPPAANRDALQARLENGGLDPSADIDGITDELIELVCTATQPSVINRTPTVGYFLEMLDEAQKKLRESASSTEPDEVIDPLDAQEADIVGEWLVEGRIGNGSTGLALLVTGDHHTAVVLKVAHDESKAARLQAEADTIRSLDHARIVKLIDGPITVGNRTALLLEDAGRPILSERLRDLGRLTLEQLEKFSADLLEAAAHLERESVFHRDIKPDSLGVRPDPGDRRPRLVLFDFSLAKEPLEAIRSGTAQYLDPFLGGAARPRYDSAAERYAVAVTLFEMATGGLPEWGDGMSDPATIADEVTVHPGLFDPSVGEPLTAFFRKALARDAGKRFGDVADMAAAWQVAFRSIAVPEDEAEQDQATRDASALAATAATPVAEAGLTPRAISALLKLQAPSVGEVMALPAMEINQMHGLGVAVRTEIQHRRAEWLKRLGVGTLVEDDLRPVGRGVEDFLARLVPSANGRNADTVTLAKTITSNDTLSTWPTWNEATLAAGLTGPDAAEALRTSWTRSVTVAELRAEVEEILLNSGWVATPQEVARVMLNRHGSTAEGANRMRNALVLVRAATEVPGDGVNIEVNRGRNPDSPILLGLGFDDDDDLASRLDAVRALATEIDAAVAERATVHGSAESLRRITESTLANTPDLPEPKRLLAVAVAASHSAALSARGEIYPRGLEPSETVRSVLAGGVRLITVDGLNRRVIERFPDAAPLPGRPTLDALVEAAAPSLHWRDSAYTRASESAGMLRTATRLTSATDLIERDYSEVVQRLTGSLASKSGVVLAVAPRSLDQAPQALANRYGVQQVNLTERLIDAMRTVAAEKGVDWNVVLRADAEPSGTRDRSMLERLVGLALDSFWSDLVARSEPLLLTDIAPVARYGQVARLSALIDLTIARPAARWLLVPHRPADGAPTVEGLPVPLAADGWIDLPTALLTSFATASAVAQ